MAWLFSSRQSQSSVLVSVEEDEEEETECECAWCLAEQEIVPTSGSHGICFFHSQQMVAQMEERRAQRRGH